MNIETILQVLFHCSRTKSVHEIVCMIMHKIVRTGDLDRLSAYSSAKHCEAMRTESGCFSLRKFSRCAHAFRADPDPAAIKRAARTASGPVGKSQRPPTESETSCPAPSPSAPWCASSSPPRRSSACPSPSSAAQSSARAQSMCQVGQSTPLIRRLKSPCRSTCMACATTTAATISCLLW